MKVLHLISSPEMGGIEVWLLELLRYAHSGEVEMDVCFKGNPVGTLAEEYEALPVTIHHCKLGYNPFGFAKRLAKILREGNYDLLHSHLNMHCGVAGLAGKMAGIKVITSLHSSRPVRKTDVDRHPLPIRLVSSIYRRISFFVADRTTALYAPVSDGVAESRFGTGFANRENVRVIYLGVKEPKIIDAEAIENLRGSLDGLDAQKIVLHVGSFTDQKNHSGLIEIFSRLIGREPNCKLLLAGDGPLRVQIETQVNKIGIESNVLFLGRRNDVTNLMQLADVFLLPSLYEGLPLALVEAAACRLPIVASRIPGIVEAVEHNKSGFLYDVTDQNGMVDALLRLLQEPETQQRTAEQARHFFETEFSMSSHFKRLTENYRSVMNGPEA